MEKQFIQKSKAPGAKSLKLKSPIGGFYCVATLCVSVKFIEPAGSSLSVSFLNTLTLLESASRDLFLYSR